MLREVVWGVDTRQALDAIMAGDIPALHRRNDATTRSVVPPEHRLPVSAKPVVEEQAPSISGSKYIKLQVSGSKYIRH